MIRNALNIIARSFLRSIGWQAARRLVNWR